MNRISRYLIVLVAGLMITPLIKAQNAKEILQKAEEKLTGKETAITDMTITIVRPKWTREMTMKSWAKGNDYSLVLITAPAKEKGTVFLKRLKEVWSWMPTIERTIKLPPSMMMQSWMGTDFTNDDLVRESSMVDDYSYKIIGDSTIIGRKCYKMQLIPKPDVAVVWGKLIVFIDKTDYIQLRSEMYDEDGYLINIMNSSKIQKMDGYTIATKMDLIPVEKKGQKTVMTINSIEFDKPIAESFFTTQNMKKIK